MKKLCVFIFMIGFLFFFISCDLISNSNDVSFDLSRKEKKDDPKIIEGETPEDENETPYVEDMSEEPINSTGDRKWTILVYMSADNQLESSAIEDLCEMQNSKIDTSEVTILALVDRSNGYNSSNGNWTGTRLYKIRTGNKVNTSEILSDEINCKPLGLTVGIDTELEMASNFTLSEVLAFVLEKYPAEYNGLIVWGHGTGWRGETDSEKIESLADKTAFKGFAYDETSGTYMTLKQMGKALQTALGSNKLDFLGFDTCFSGEIEVAYELRNTTRFFVGTEGLISSSGWNYKKLFDRFAETEKKTPEKLCNSVIYQFADQYAYTPRASICAVKTEYLEDYVSSFNEFCYYAGKSVTSLKTHDELFGALYTNKECLTERYTYGAEGYDVYLDVNSLVENTLECVSSPTLKEISIVFKDFEEKLYLDYWASDRDFGGLGVYFSTYGAGGILNTVHPAGYISGKTINQIDFVRKCTGYVPGLNSSSGLLDALFYRDFS